MLRVFIITYSNSAWPMTFIYSIIEKNTKMSTLDLVEEDLEGLNLQGMFKTLLIIHKQNTKEIIAVKEPLYVINDSILLGLLRTRSPP